jgi:hypothetical protein
MKEKVKKGMIAEGKGPEFRCWNDKMTTARKSDPLGRHVTGPLSFYYYNPALQVVDQVYAHGKMVICY